MSDLVETYIENRWTIQPNHANNHQTVHGGNVLKWMDEVGAMSAKRFTANFVLTAAMDQVNFRRPIPVGDTALLESYVYESGETSVRVRCRAYREDPYSGDVELTTESHLVFVAVDEEFEPTAVPELTTSTDRGEELRSSALASDDSI